MISSDHAIDFYAEYLVEVVSFAKFSIPTFSIARLNYIFAVPVFWQKSLNQIFIRPFSSLNFSDAKFRNYPVMKRIKRALHTPLGLR